MSDVKAQAQDASEDSVDRAVREARAMKDEAADTIDNYLRKAETLQQDLLDEVRERPLRALAIGAVIGFAIGAIWKS